MKKIIQFAVVLSFGYTGLFAQQKHSQKLTTVFEDQDHQLTGVAVSASERVFTNYPRWGEPYRYALVEVTGTNTSVPFPDESWNEWSGTGDKMKHFLCVQAVVIDDQNSMWVVDAGSTQPSQDNDKGQKLVKINLTTNTVERVYPLAGASDGKSYMNDTRIDTRKKLAYITNSNEGGIVIVDLVSGKVRQVLNKAKVTQTDPAYQVKRNGKTLLRDGQPFHVQSDGIALSPNGKQLYFKALTDNSLYHISTADLNNELLSEADLEKKVVFDGKFTTTDGMAFDHKGNLYLGDLEERKIIRITPSLKTETVIPANEELAWPDSYHITKDGWLYISCSRIDEQPQFHQGKSERKGSYKIYKIHL